MEEDKQNINNSATPSSDSEVRQPGNPANAVLNPKKIFFHRILRVVYISLVTIFILFVGLMIYRIPFVKERLRTQEAVDKIHAQKLTLADVMGQNLPLEPDSALKDSTIEGIDANGNGIRDDVELAIFKLHPDSARIRAAELQYAMALQNEMTSNVFNSETLVAVIQQEDRGFFCIGDAVPNKSPDKQSGEIDSLVFNNIDRNNKHEEVFKKYMTSYGSEKGSSCDIDLLSLPN